MADDIIDRLRCSYADPPCEQCTFCAARAEIERLRALGDDLAEECWNNRSADAAVKAWWEARRG